MKKIIFAFAVLITIFSLVGCGEKKILHCDHCGIAVHADAGSAMEEDWIIYCPKCNDELFGEDGLDVLEEDEDSELSFD